MRVLAVEDGKKKNEACGGEGEAADLTAEDDFCKVDNNHGEVIGLGGFGSDIDGDEEHKLL